MASSTASSTYAAAKQAAVAAHPPALVTDRTGMAFTGTIASGHVASTSARRYPPASSSSVLQTTRHPAGPPKEVMLSPELPTPGTHTRDRRRDHSLSCDPGGKRPHSPPSTIRHSP